MESEFISAGMRLLAAALAGGVIGLERAYSGREAGFRTHILVAIASALLMLLLDYQWLNTPSEYLNTVRVDPTRMAQGIMTGIGFLGAGVILHNRHSVRGLTTAASIWITSAIGIILGSGYYDIGALACVLALVTLSLFRALEAHLPTRRYARLAVATNSGSEQLEALIREQLERLGIAGNGFAYRYQAESRELELQSTVSTYRRQGFEQLEKALISLDTVLRFDITPLDN